MRKSGKIALIVDKRCWNRDLEQCGRGFWYFGLFFMGPKASLKVLSPTWQISVTAYSISKMPKNWFKCPKQPTKKNFIFIATMAQIYLSLIFGLQWSYAWKSSRTITTCTWNVICQWSRKCTMITCRPGSIMSCLGRLKSLNYILSNLHALVFSQETHTRSHWWSKKWIMLWWSWLLLESLYFITPKNCAGMSFFIIPPGLVWASFCHL